MSLLISSLLRGTLPRPPETPNSRITTYVPDMGLAIYWAVGASKVGTRTLACIAHFPPNPVDWDAAIYATWLDPHESGWIKTGSYGNMYGSGFNDAALSSIGAGSYHGVIDVGQALTGATSGVAVRSLADMYAVAQNVVWVAWSNIGSVDFTLGRDNVAGKAPMLWGGVGYKAKKLRNTIVIYGSSGISIMKPSGKFYGVEDISDVGVVGEGSVAGDDTVHFFVDAKYRLWMLSDKLDRLDYSEYLSILTGSLVLTWDEEKKLLYLCNGTYGFVYSPEMKSMGSCPGNITGIGLSASTKMVVSDGDITTPAFQITSDIFDFGNRKFKTIMSLEVGSDMSYAITSAVEYRLNYTSAFISTDWFYTNPDGKSYPLCHGVEFRFKFRTLTYGYFELDYVKIKGKIHKFNYLDAFGKWGE